MPFVLASLVFAVTLSLLPSTEPPTDDPTPTQPTEKKRRQSNVDLVWQRGRRGSDSSRSSEDEDEGGVVRATGRRRAEDGLKSRAREVKRPNTTTGSEMMARADSPSTTLPPHAKRRRCASLPSSPSPPASPQPEHSILLPCPDLP